MEAAEARPAGGGGGGGGRRVGEWHAGDRDQRHWHAYFADLLLLQAEKRGERSAKSPQVNGDKDCMGECGAHILYCLWKKSRRVAGFGLQVGEDASAV